ncbi:MAG: beta-Ala-His dipeptidase [Candidatus Lokiarchaeota archaeon]
MVLENLKPHIVWNIFENIIAETPRPSKHEDKIRNKIKVWLKDVQSTTSMEFQMSQDEVGNLFIIKPASKGFENSPSILLQAHLDMVCISNRPEGFDFHEEGIPIRIQENKEWIDSDGTSLGADDGIGVALALAILTDPKIKHGPIEVLFTVNEEDGFTGATQLDVNRFNINSKYMINLDSGPFGKITIGSVCGRRVYISKKLEVDNNEKTEDLDFIELSVSGLRGGHSGGDIHLPRANANKILSRILSKLIENIDIYLSEWNGGFKTNVIPMNSKVIFAFRKLNEDKFKAIIDEEISHLYEYYKQRKYNTDAPEPDIVIEWSKAKPRNIFSLHDSRNAIIISHLIPNGVMKKSPFFEEFVETSINLGVIKTEDNTLTFESYPRSIFRPELHDLVNSLIQLTKLAGWDYRLRPILPEWKPALKSDFLDYVKKQYESVLGEMPKIQVTHGGLETGEISLKITDLQIVALGPTVEGEHSPSENFLFHSSFLVI